MRRCWRLSSIAVPIPAQTAAFKIRTSITEFEWYPENRFDEKSILPYFSCFLSYYLAKVKVLWSLIRNEECYVIKNPHRIHNPSRKKRQIIGQVNSSNFSIDSSKITWCTTQSRLTTSLVKVQQVQKRVLWRIERQLDWIIWLHHPVWLQTHRQG